MHLKSGKTSLVVLRDGRFQGDLSSRPLRVVLTTDSPPDGTPLRLPAIDIPGAPEGTAVDVHALFDEGLAVPPDGRLHVQLSWGAPCHSEHLPDSPSRKRFASWEHVICARYVGLDAASENAKPLQFHNARAPFDKDTRLPVDNKELTFGEIICLGGDFYAHLDTRSADELTSAWPRMTGVEGWLAGDYRATTLQADSFQNVKEILKIIRRDKDTDQGASGEFASYAFGTGEHDHAATKVFGLGESELLPLRLPEAWNRRHKQRSVDPLPGLSCASHSRGKSGSGRASCPKGIARSIDH